MLSKKCTLCDKTFTVENQDDFIKYFFRDNKGKYKHNARCKPCCTKEKQKLYKKHPEKMNPNYVRKAYLKNCIVCSNEFLAREERHICCSEDCKKFKNNVKRKLSRSVENRCKIKRQKEILNAKVRFKHYTKDEKDIIRKMLEKNYSYEKIAKKLGRTTAGVGKIARKVLRGE
jgi:hypothetical protein